MSAPIDDPKNFRDLLDKFADLQAEADAEGSDAGEADDVDEAQDPSSSSKPKKKKKKSKSKASKAIQKLKDISSGSVPSELVNQVQAQLVNDTPAGAAPPTISEKEIKKALQAVDLIKLLEGKQALGNTSNTKDLGEHKFWKTQPVIQTVPSSAAESEGPIDPPRTVNEVRQEPLPLPAGYEWSEIDIKDPVCLSECQTLLSENYVEDPDASFRLGYTNEFLKWALCPPGYEKNWHIGIRVSGNKKLVAFISGIPMDAQVRDQYVPPHLSQPTLTLPPQRIQSRRDQLSLRPQETPQQTPRTSPHQGNHPPRQPLQHLASSLHRRRRHPHPDLHMSVLPPEPQPVQTRRYRVHPGREGRDHFPPRSEIRVARPPAPPRLARDARSRRPGREGVVGDVHAEV
jgi:hypothetical protein